ncbi:MULTISPECIES: acyltransferase [Pseudoalteromonas]|uniref:acyltransferase n=1 Tax=Pseudoalteromonas TaxID=53246 RepID=UPI000C34D62B|nr:MULTISPECIES: acyltransferase [Pseudoalteromonas]PKG65444.1 acyltransferase [Pseudoalteromonas arctica]PKG69562.1 acyltransferase [Pseudoalteromonas sp. GutCa3]
MHNILFLVTSRFFGRIFKSFCFFSKNINLSEGVQFRSVPIFEVHKSAKLSLGKSVLINSSNYGYHINMHSKTKIVLHDNAELSIGNFSRIHGVSFHVRKSITIGSRVLMAAGCVIIDNNGHSIELSKRLSEVDEPKSIVIGDDVWLATNVVVTPGSYVGDNSIVSANSVVRGRLEGNGIYAGNPAVIVKHFN